MIFSAFTHRSETSSTVTNSFATECIHYCCAIARVRPIAHGSYISCVQIVCAAMCAYSILLACVLRNGSRYAFFGDFPLLTCDVTSVTSAKIPEKNLARTIPQHTRGQNAICTHSDTHDAHTRNIASVSQKIKLGEHARHSGPGHIRQADITVLNSATAIFAPWTNLHNRQHVKPNPKLSPKHYINHNPNF